MKKCTTCGRELPLEEFPTNRRKADGHLDVCFSCFRAKTDGRSKLTPEQRKEKQREYHRKYRALHPYTEEQKTQRRMKQLERYYRKKADPEAHEKQKEYMRAYYHAHKHKWDKYRKPTEVGSSIG